MIEHDSKTLRRAALYARQSEDVAEGISRQLERARKLAEARGMSVAAEYIDNAVSASGDRSRSRWGEMLKDAAAGRFDVVIAVDVDRLLRSIADLSDITRTGVAVLTVDGEIDLTTADGEFRATMLAGIARFEVRRKGERQKRANESRTRAGLPVPGKRRFGFEPGNLVERTAEADQVRWAFETMATGGTVYGIAQKFGRPPVRVREILTNPCYAGWVVRHGERFEAHESVARVVARDLFEDVQIILAEASRRTTPGPQRRYLASGIARCGVCQRGLVSMTEYACPDPARHVFIKRQALHRALSEAVRDELARLVEEPAPEVESSEARTLRAERAELQRQRQRGQKLALMQDVDLEALQGELSAAQARLVAIDAKLAEIALESRSVGVMDTAREYGLVRARYDAEGRTWDLWTDIDVALSEADWSEAWSAMPLDARRALVDDLLDVTVNSAKADKPRIDIRAKRMETPE